MSQPRLPLLYQEILLEFDQHSRHLEEACLVRMDRWVQARNLCSPLFHHLLRPRTFHSPMEFSVFHHYLLTMFL